MQSLILQNESLILHPYRAIYWPKEDALLLSDLHLGKGAHFRRSGIAVPEATGMGNFWRMEQLLLAFQPGRILFLGDLFHSDYNQVWEQFADFIANNSSVSFELIPGNHDILGAKRYEAAGLLLQEEILELGPFWLTHHPMDEADLPADKYVIAGHVHPCVRMSNTGGRRGSIRLPAFWFGPRQGLLPAFGEFTGGYTVPVGKGDRVFVLVEGEILAV
ncbi:MAG: ligase-associated DNA damage response endonuclease PdeM [Bacteroidota bacterium]